MAKFSVVRRMPFSARQLFALAGDVAAYPEFVPLCQDAKIWDEKQDGPHVRSFTASLLIVYDKLKLQETFISDVSTDNEALTIRAVSDKGPVKQLENIWRFVDIAGTNECDVEFSLDYEMSSRVLQFAMSTMFDYAVRKMMAAFEQRAADIYGPRA